MHPFMEQFQIHLTIDLLNSHLLILQKHVDELAVLHPLQALGHYVSRVAFSTDVLRRDYPLVGVVSDLMVPEVNML